MSEGKSTRNERWFFPLPPIFAPQNTPFSHLFVGFSLYKRKQNAHSGVWCGGTKSGSEWRVGKFWWFFGRKCLPPFSQPSASSHTGTRMEWMDLFGSARSEWDETMGVRGSAFHSTTSRTNRRPTTTTTTTEPRRNRFTTPSS